MGAMKKYLENRIRGWLPQEPNLPNYQRALSQRSWSWLKWYAALILINAGAGGLLSVLAWFIGLGRSLGLPSGL